MKNIDETLQKMTLLEKAYLLSGTNFMYTNAIERLDIPSVCTSDGPHGLRKQTEGAKDNGISTSEPATSFPTAVATASGWNPNNLYQMGEAIGRECGHYGVDVLLGPGVNIKRNPLCGRNFEYFSEDPYLAGCMGTAHIQGVMHQHVDVSVKHFALNNSENYRFMGNSVVDERTAREIYLKAFERIVKQAHPKSVMCAYNQINGTFCSQNQWLLTDVLRDEWGFDGIVMSDWGASKDREQGVKAGMELEMPGDTAISKKMIMDAVRDGRLKEKELDTCVRRMLEFIKNCEENRKLRVVKSGMLTEAMRDEHHKLAADIAKDCAVLLKNEDNILPLDSHAGRKLLVIGELFEKMRYQGAGSSMIHPARLTTPKDAFNARNISYIYEKGYHEADINDEALVKQAVSAAKKLSEEGVILIFCGLTDYAESEGADRASLELPKNQLELITQLLKTGRKIVVVLYGGSVVTLPFEKNVSAILNMFLPGQAGGEATAALLFGESNPSGRLAETWVKSYADVPYGKDFGKHINEVYREGIYVGYRYYETNDVQVQYPFGYGLSYTQFAYANMKTQMTDKGIELTIDVTNTGRMSGAEVVQCYVCMKDSLIERPVRELKAFNKVFLEPGETKTVTLFISYEDLMVFHPKTKQMTLEAGNYEFALMKNAHETIKTDNKIKNDVLIKKTERFVDGQKSEKVCVGNATKHQEAMSELIFISKEMSEKISQKPLHNFAKPVIVDANTHIEEPKKMPITLESRFTDLKQTWMGNILFNAVLSVAKKSEKEAKKLPAGTQRDNQLKGALFLKRILESNSLRTMSMSAGTSFPYHMALGMRDMANGHIFKGIRHMIHPIKVEKINESKKS